MNNQEEHQSVLSSNLNEQIFIDGTEGAPMTREHFVRLKNGGVNIVINTVAGVKDDFSQATLKIHKLYKSISENKDKAMLIRSNEDIYIAKRENKIGVIIGFQSPSPINNNIEYLFLLYKLGVRSIQITYNERSLLGDGCLEEANAGLSRFGKKIIQEMNKSGILVDLGHCGERTTIEAIEYSKTPVIISHANPKAICPSPRNKADDILKCLAEHNGVIGVAFWAPIAYINPNTRPVVDDIFAHIDHLVNRIGIDHVGIGSDLGEGESSEGWDETFLVGGGIYPEVTGMLGSWFCLDNQYIDGLESVAYFSKVGEVLYSHGYQEIDVNKILGGNFLRVLLNSMRPISTNL